MEFLFEALQDCEFKVGLKKGDRIYKNSPSNTEYSTTVKFDPEQIDKILLADSQLSYPTENQPSERRYDGEGFVNMGFQFIKGGICTEPPLRVDGEKVINEKLKQIFPTLQSETVVRLAHKGIYPIKSTGGYMYFTDKDNKLIGASKIEELAQKLIDTKPKENKRLKRIERAELKYFNLL